MFIGSREIKLVTPSDDDTLTVEFEDGGKVQLKNNTLDLISSEEKRTGDVIDSIQYNFACKYVKDMAEHGLNFLESQVVSQGIVNLANNIKEEAIGMAFGYKHSLDIKISDVYDMFDKKEEEESGDAEPQLTSPIA
jgi:hypothetical protein